ncbi:MAG: Rne/Rng family ribonuclease [Thermodesulfovibrio sp.]|uniref:Rne/Rng family ribonuclease n=1 Tax=unclassified Thermodesulfovibrio TaxID=2645936 RepID=UPI00083A684B|nr:MULTISPECIES: Rne/Rng family ribonuclease [unclassified Thermodesulfovibrio]MDI1470946.1 Rne/Rng family ribonuclease [Thermodesulfovibrio sp. 1176]MDI6713796.1 Rne/Rng family ribonuclease [Thermodesulfovibrio sp.]ODA45131.1 Cytoplasmic axial filament protein CafA [Thermodesulfovibrio sp. N1]
MSNELLINVTKQECRVALLEGGQVVEFYIERKGDASFVGNIYKGRVVKVLKGMQACFIDIGLDKAAFLYVDDIRGGIKELYPFLEGDEETEFISKLDFKDASIEELVQQGQEILVQVAKDPIGTKGARVTSRITLPGRYVVLMPGMEHIGVSRKIEDEEKRKQLKELATKIKPTGFGLIMRTVSEDASEEEIKRDIDFLLLLWDNIQKKKDKVHAPSLIHSEFDLVLRSLRDFMNQNVDRLIIDNYNEWIRLKEFAQIYFPRIADKIELFEGDEPIFDAFGVEVDLDRSLERKVWLKSGGYIVIDQTEAMTVIDVNTGKFVGKENLEDTILRTNLEAVKEIAYQIRLRNLGGIILIDFIDMEKDENKQKVINAMAEAMKKDRAKTTIYNITDLGIVQMTRKRTRESLEHILCDSCPYCEGKGRVKSAKTVAYEVLRKLKFMTLQEGTEITVILNPQVADLLTDEERDSLEEIENSKKIRITIKKDSSLHRENYSIYKNPPSIE